MADERRWNRLEHAERRAQILDVAHKLFSERSYSQVSMEEIAAAAGIRRGLLHHYFGSKRDLFMEVVRMLMAHTAVPLADDPSLSREVRIGKAVDRWMRFVAKESATWFAVLGAEGFGHDPELEAIVAEGRDATVERIIAMLGITEPTEHLRAVIRAYGGLAEATTREWLQRRTLTREQARALLITTMVTLIESVIPAVESAHSPDEGKVTA